METSAANIYAQVMQHDPCAFIHRSFLELNPQRPVEPALQKQTLHVKSVS